MDNCIFCQIISKKSKANIVLENDLCIAFTPLDPISSGHVLVVPKAHFENIFDIDEKTLAELTSYSKKIAAKIVKNNDAKGINLLHASGKDAQQSVFHFHFHVVPRYENDGLDLWMKGKL